MGTAVVTALLYMSMARSFLAFLSNIVRTDGWICSMLDAHKELHIFFGRMLGWYAIAHCCGHCMSTVIIIMQTRDSLEKLDELNSIFGCSNQETKSFWFWGQAHLSWPTCPIKVQYKYVEEVFFMTTIGLSGVLLCILLTVIAYVSSKRARSQDFERFWYLHNVAIVLWPVLMYIHGSNAWVGGLRAIDCVHDHKSFHGLCKGSCVPTFAVSHVPLHGCHGQVGHLPTGQGWSCAWVHGVFEGGKASSFVAFQSRHVRVHLHA